jgi:FAD dependent oxidoreductase
MTGYDVVVIGGGVAGTSCAYHLRRLGAGRVLVLERFAGDRPAPLEFVPNAIRAGVRVGQDLASAEPQRPDRLLREVRVAAVVLLDGLAVLCAVDLDAETLVAKEEVGVVWAEPSLALRLEILVQQCFQQRDLSRRDWTLFQIAPSSAIVVGGENRQVRDERLADGCHALPAKSGGASAWQGSKLFDCGHTGDGSGRFGQGLSSPGSADSRGEGHPGRPLWSPRRVPFRA